MNQVFVLGLRLAGAPWCCTGPGAVEQAHATDEHVSLDATERVARVLVRATSALLERDRDSLSIQVTEA